MTIAAKARESFFRGVQSIPPIIVGILPFGIVTGITAVQVGWSPFDAALQSATIYAGMSQIAFLQLLMDAAPWWIVLATVAAINARMLLYSAAIANHLAPLPRKGRAILAFWLTDQVYAMCALSFTANALRPTERVYFYLGCGLPLYCVWILATWFGAWFGAWIPATWSLEFAVPLVFLTLLIPLIKDFSMLLSATVGGGMTLLLYQLPNNSGFFIAICSGIMAGVVYELLLQRYRRNKARDSY